MHSSQHDNSHTESLHEDSQQALLAEQGYVDTLFEHLDSAVQDAQQRLEAVMLRVDPANPDAESLVEREVEYHSLNEKIDRLNIAQLGLVFGRIDVAMNNPDLIDNPVPGQPLVDRRYIGRMGILAKDDDYRSLLLDWRAPLARPFYLATTAQPEGVQQRRHIRTKGRTVTAIDDEHLDGHKVTHDIADVASETPLMRALSEARTGHMSSIVETIQREQDTIIRDATRGIMVVEGGPGTGKTAVALHRIAYLLYTWREQLAKTGVLIIGPNRTFLDYISRVLPELGETGVVLSTIGELYPGVRPGMHPESLLTREVKGSIEMLTILKRAVQTYQHLPERSMELRIEGITLELTPQMVKQSITRARRSRQPHNFAQPVFREALAAALATQLKKKIGEDPLGGSNLLSAADEAQLHDDILDEPSFNSCINELWPLLEPTEVLANLLSDAKTIEAAAYDYDEETQGALLRSDGTAWSNADAALLDELATLIGLASPDERAAEAEEAWRQQVADAEEALDVLIGSANTDLDDESDAEILSAHDVIDAETLATRQEVRDIRTTAQRARADHQWAYGHVIIDEAQELTPMEWRMVMRRCPAKWMTIVGDTSQTGSPAGVDDWSDALAPFVQQRFRTHHLSVNYRTPAEIMVLADAVRSSYAPDIPAMQALRHKADAVRFSPTAAEDATPAAIWARAWQIAQKLHEEDPQRLVCLICADTELPEYENLAATEPANEQIQLLPMSAVKGLEFDHVVLLDPQLLIDASPQGLQDLYVALTRATQTLTLVGTVPELFAGMYDHHVTI